MDIGILNIGRPQSKFTKLCDVSEYGNVVDVDTENWDIGSVQKEIIALTKDAHDTLGPGKTIEIRGATRKNQFKNSQIAWYTNNFIINGDEDKITEPKHLQDEGFVYLGRYKT